MKLLVVIPALNEAATLADVIAAIPRGMADVDEVEVLVVDDGSTDATGEVARAAGATVVHHARNRGVGAAFQTGLAAALERGADLIVNMDADGQFDPAGIPQLVAPILEGRAEMTTCTRFARPDLVPRMPWIKKWGNRMMCRLVNWICWGGGYTDVSCGFRAYNRDTALRLTLFGQFTYTQETFVDLIAKGIAIAEVPLPVRGVRAVGDSRVASNLPTYAARTASIILRVARDVRPLAFFGGLGAILLTLGVICGGTVFGWWLFTGHTSPIRSVLFGATVFLILGFLVIVLALLADMLGRQRILMQEVLFRLRSKERR
ncbi:MAG: glycosyltransferase family 2 protein [Planctomycetota bacterium]